MDKQPEALRLADELESEWVAPYEFDSAAELRRLHQVNQELVEAAQQVLSRKRGDGDWLILATHCAELERVLAKHKGQA